MWVTSTETCCIHRSEVPGRRILQTSPFGHSPKFGRFLCYGALCVIEYIHSPKPGVCCLRYVASRGRVKAQDSYLPPSRCGPATQPTTQPTTCAWEKRRRERTRVSKPHGR